MGLRSVILEGDALEVVEQLKRVNEDAGYLCNLIGESEIRFLLRSFDCWSIDHIKREGNKAAHTLAKFAISHPQNRVSGYVSSESNLYFSSA
jgi:hypothetical protein